MSRKPNRRKPAAEPAAPRRWPEFVLSLLAFLIVAGELDPTGTYAWLPDGPGLTIDEVINVQQGVRTEIGLRAWLAGGITLRELFGDFEMLGPRAPFGYHATDYPPLGRYLLGVAHNFVTTFAFPANWGTHFVVAAARFGSALAFAITIWLVASFTSDAFGRPAGLLAGVSLLLMPRLLGHAHLASLETMIGLFYTGTIISIARRWEVASPVSNRAAIFAGIWWGLALLVKIQAILLPLPVTIWAFYHWRGAAVRPLAIMATVGAAVFFFGWPWLWFDPLDHAFAYFAQTTDRASLPVWYMGQVWADVDVPWHYPFVMTAVTVPIGLLALSGAGLLAGTPVGWREPRCQLMFASFLTPLVVFALPGVTVYDGVRLFLVAFPLLAILAGRGGGIAWNWLRGRFSIRAAVAVVALFLAIQATAAWSVRPVYLSGYNWAVGGLAGAEALGFEVNYWGDALTSEILSAAADQIPKGGTLAVSPVLHQFQLDDLRTQTPSLRARDIRLVEYGTPEAAVADGLLIYQRRASLPEQLRKQLDDVQPTAAIKRQGVRLSALFVPAVGEGGE